MGATEADKPQEADKSQEADKPQGILEPWRKALSNINFMLAYIVMFTVAAGTFIIAISLLSPKPEATKDVLPFATGLVGFLGGLVTALFGAAQGLPGEKDSKTKTDGKGNKTTTDGQKS